MRRSLAEAEVQCVECGQFMDRFAAFVCKSCKRRPLCPTHKDNEYGGLCVGCASRLRRAKLAGLQSGLRSLQGFIRLLQFLFLLFAVMFAAKRLMPGIAPGFILENFFVKHLYVWGGLSALGFLVLYVVYLGQKSAAESLASEIQRAAPVAVHRIIR